MRNDELTEADELLIDEVCLRFEKAWQTGDTPNLELFLTQHSKPVRARLARELVLLDCEYRQRNAEPQNTERYQEILQEFPHLKTELADFVVRGSPDPARTPPTLDLVVRGSTDSAQTPPTLDVSGYEILEVLGQGGMGIVYKARHVKLKRIVALKMILAGAHAGPDQLVRFMTEAEAVARLQHPNIVQIYDIGERDGVPYFSLEYCPGGSLAAKLAGTPMQPKEAAAIVEKLARAIQLAHDHKIIHRDLKPANILLSAARSPLPVAATGEARPRTTDHEPRTTPKITDFGLAKKLDEAARTTTGAVMGTPSYMAPEQARGEISEVGPSADVYALGAIMYECLTGRPPFRGPTAVDTLMQVAEDEPVTPSQLQSRTPRDLETITLKCLQKEPHKRYASAEILAEDLRRFQAGEPIQARPVTRREKAIKWMRRNPAVASLTAAVLAVLLAGTGVASGLAIWALGERDRAEAEKRLAEERKTEADEAKNDADEKRLKAEWLVYAGKISLAQREWELGNVYAAQHTLNDCQVDLRGWEHEYLWNLFNCNSLCRHTNQVESVSFSPDGKHIASGSSDNTIKVYERLAGKVVLTLRGHTGPVTSVSFDRHSKRIASASLDGTVRIWNAKSGREVFSFRRHKGRVPIACFTLDGDRVVSAGSDKTLKIWKAETGQIRQSLEVGHVTSMSCSPDGKHIAVGSRDKVKIWDIQSGRNVITLNGHKSTIRNVCYSPDGKRIVSSSYDMTAKVWDLATGREIFTLRGHKHNMSGLTVSYSPDGKRIVSGCKTIKIWHAKTGKEIVTLRGHALPVSCVQYSPDSKRIVSGSFDKTVKVWSEESGRDALTLRGHASYVNSVCFSRDGRHLVSASKTVKVWDTQTGKEIALPHPHDGYYALITPDGERIASSSKTVKLWDMHTGKDLATLRNPGKNSVLKLCFSSDGNRIAGCGDKTAIVWDVKAAKIVATLNGHSQRVTSVCFSPDGKRIATASYDNTARVWDAQTGKNLFTLRDKDSLWCVCYSPDGTSIITGSRDGTLKSWDAQTGQVLNTLRGHTGQVICVCFSPDGKRIASGSETLKVWNAETGQNLITLRGQKSIWSICFSPDGKRIASGGTDNTIKVWDARSLGW